MWTQLTCASQSENNIVSIIFRGQFLDIRHCPKCVSILSFCLTRNYSLHLVSIQSAVNHESKEIKVGHRFPGLVDLLFEKTFWNITKMIDFLMIMSIEH